MPQHSTQRFKEGKNIMALTPEQRAEINKANAARSTGPRSEQGKRSSRLNSLKHGLRAEALTLPSEDPEVVAVRIIEWNDYYQPNSPAAQHLVNECVQATLLSERCHRYHRAILAKQIRESEETWDNAREDEIAGLQILLKTDAATAVRELKRSVEGLRWLIQEWETLDASLVKNRKWHTHERLHALSLLGETPDTKFVDECFLNWHKDAEGNLLDLKTRLKQLETEIDIPARAEFADRALLPQDPNTARLFLRYQAEARTSFHRSYSALLKTLQLDATMSSALAEIASPNEANAPKAVEAASPNEANAAEPVEAASPNEANAAEAASPNEAKAPEPAEPASPNEANSDPVEAPELPKTPVVNVPTPQVMTYPGDIYGRYHPEQKDVTIR
jgi:hypothetical protein